jgi:hypothetical protein
MSLSRIPVWDAAGRQITGIGAHCAISSVGHRTHRTVGWRLPVTPAPGWCNPGHVRASPIDPDRSGLPTTVLSKHAPQASCRGRPRPDGVRGIGPRAYALGLRRRPQFMGIAQVLRPPACSATSLVDQTPHEIQTGGNAVFRLAAFWRGGSPAHRTVSCTTASDSACTVPTQIR